MAKDLSSAMNQGNSDILEGKTLEVCQPAREAFPNLSNTTTKATENPKISLTSMICALTKSVSGSRFGIEHVIHIRAINKLGKAQFVFWKSLENDFAKNILLEKDKNLINRLLQDQFCKNTLDTWNGIAKKCLEHESMDNYKKIFNQCEMAFLNESNDLAIIGLCSIIDGLLSDLSLDYDSVKLLGRLEELEEGVSNVDNGITDSDKTALLTLLITLNNTFELYDAHYEFSDKEPEFLNRHWIMHGRSKSQKADLDCLKIQRILCGLLLLDDLIQGKEGVV